MTATLAQTDPEISTSEREKFFTALYERAFPFVAKFVSARNGTFEEAKDIFHDALVIFYEKKLQAYEHEIAIDEESYLVGIAKHLWLRKYNHDKKLVPLTALEQNISIPEDYFVKASEKKLLSVVEHAGKKCLDLLQEFYFKCTDMKEIVKHFGFGSIRSATVQKYKCLEKIRDYVKENTLHYEDFTE